MKQRYRPVILTIVFGALCALLFLPFMYGAAYLVSWRMAFRLALSAFLACYAVGLAEWGNGHRQLIVIPLAMLVGLTLLEQSHSVFLLLLLGLFAIIRSSLVQHNLLRVIVSEGILSLGGGLLIYGLNPTTNLAWAFGIWLFFLIQSLYFVM